VFLSAYVLEYAVWERDTKSRMMAMSDPYDLERFVEAQRGTYEQACAELQRGRKTGHWMWFVFPQIAGLGMSSMSQRYAIGSLDEARAYLAHAVLGARLRAICGILLGIEGRTAEEIFGWPDDMKLWSSMTLFAHASGDERVFVDVLAKYFGGKRDGRTLEMLQS
jgi:uncharacterized protein (DUF1810 family)